ncbi:MAG: hypothetical protein QW544_00755 [Candidatus Caldarchaeum sp.]
MRSEQPTLRLGLNLPMFIAALIAIATGTFVGMLGIWTAAAWGRPVPEWEKVGHAHSAWWSVLILIAALVLPSLQLKPWAKKLIIAGTFAGPTLWVGVLASYYEIGGPSVWRLESPTLPGTYYELPVIGVVAFVLELLGFVALGIVGLSAAGINIPAITAKEPQPKSRYEFLSEVEVPRRIFLIPTLLIALGVIVGYAINAVFKLVHQPVSPSALVQLHDHTALLSTSSMLLLTMMSVMRVRPRIQNLAFWLMQVGLPLTFLGLLAFNFGALPSVVWVAPAAIYYLLILLSIPVALGIYSTVKGETKEHAGGRLTAFNTALTVCLVGLAILIAVGAYVAVTWDVSPNITVTYKQPEGVPYPGPYPAKYLGTAPVKETPRGLENAHLSPGSWYHVAIAWLLILSLFGASLFGANRVGLLYLFAITIPMAPTFNMLGRFLAWLGIPNGIGALWFAGHPLKGFNLISLFITALLATYVAGRKTAVIAKHP